ncbi:GNAT family N-acetyltransferase [Bacillus fonticola]|uniref:GNAT family N-acetyltransferase n=1 Tax=Bacillus fonticola TaxID=2728853 RepID=UPI001474E043|nr:GNAT family N-acetyltransferase [Bacillus fonticola]
MRPILRDFPERIETERLYIRPCLPGDGEEVYAAIEDSFDALHEWMPFAKERPVLDEVEANIRESYAKFVKREDFRLHIYRKEDAQFVGSTGFHYVRWDIPKCEIGYWAHQQYAGNGYISEAVRVLTEFAFAKLGMRRVEIQCDEENVNSRHVAEACGYELEGIMKADSMKPADGSLRNTCIYANFPK